MAIISSYELFFWRKWIVSRKKNGIKCPPSALEAVLVFFFLKPGCSCWNVFKCSYTDCVLTTWADCANIHLQEIFCFSKHRSHPASMGKRYCWVWCNDSLFIKILERGWKSTSIEDKVFREARFHPKCKKDGFYYRVSASAVYLRKSSAEIIELIYVIRNTWCLSWWIIIAIPCCKIAHGAVKWSWQCICDERSIISRHLAGI